MKSKHFEQIVFLFFVAVLSSAGAAFGAFRYRAELQNAAAWAWNRKDLAADILIASYAHWKAGKPVEQEADYSYDFTSSIWNMETNSEWLINYTNMIVPMLVYEKISVGDGVYPRAIIFSPYEGARSEHISGSTYPMYGIVLINDRHLLDTYWQDQRDTLVTLVHELIHVQGGAFACCFSAQLEAATSAATIEALAGMCNFGDQLACQAFWHDIEFTARNDLRYRLAAMGRDDLYRKIAAILWQDKVEEAYTEKKARFWKDNYLEFVEVLAKYDYVPWREMIIPGVLNPDTWRLDTKLVYERRVQGMPYDDASILLGWVKELMKIVVME